MNSLKLCNRERKQRWSAFYAGMALNVGVGIFWRMLTSNCVCRIFSHLLGQKWAGRILTPTPQLSFIHGKLVRVDIILNVVDHNNRIYVVLGTDSTKDMFDE